MDLLDVLAVVLIEELSREIGSCFVVFWQHIFVEILSILSYLVNFVVLVVALEITTF